MVLHGHARGCSAVGRTDTGGAAVRAKPRWHSAAGGNRDDAPAVAGGLDSSSRAGARCAGRQQGPPGARVLRRGAAAHRWSPGVSRDDWHRGEVARLLLGGRVSARRKKRCVIARPSRGLRGLDNHRAADSRGSRRGGPSAFAEASADRRSLGGGWSGPPDVRRAACTGTHRHDVAQEPRRRGAESRDADTGAPAPGRPPTCGRGTSSGRQVSAVRDTTREVGRGVTRAKPPAPPPPPAAPVSRGGIAPPGPALPPQAQPPGGLPPSAPERGFLSADRGRGRHRACRVPHPGGHGPRGRRRPHGDHRGDRVAGAGGAARRPRIRRERHVGRRLEPPAGAGDAQAQLRAC